MRLMSVLLITLSTLILTARADESPIHTAAALTTRTPEHTLRDEYRHPVETLEFFGLSPDMTVVEIWPGAGGWYTEILAPLLYDKGKLFAAQFNEDSTSSYFRDSRKIFEAKLQADPDVYGKTSVTSFNPPEHVAIAPPGSVDMVLTFRNVHNWYMRGGGDERVIAGFKAIYQALKPGGVLGVVDHRLPAGTPLSEQESSGYMREDYVIRMVQQAGFELVASAEINSNSKDTAVHPNGVWSLPPTLRGADTNRDQLIAIGESDRMTLKFRKTNKQSTQ